MSKTFSIWIAFFTACLLVACTETDAPTSHEQTVIMIGIDGLRNDAIHRADAPNLQALAARGVEAESLRPAMPTKTFTNFYTLATGLHPKNHGLISNYPYDREIGRAFSRATDTQDPAWWGGEPIWITAEKQGAKAATYFWVGSEVPIDGIRPSLWKPFDQKKDYAERVEEVLGWLDLPTTTRPRLVTLYFSAVDTAAHDYGVGTVEELAAIEKVDGHVGDLVAGLEERGLTANTNIIIVSDHGMVDLADDKIINLDPIVSLDAFEVPDWGRQYGPVYAPFLNLYGSQTDIDAAYAALEGKHPHMQVFRRPEFPKQYHFDHPTRGPDIMILADLGWTLYASEDGSAPVSLWDTPASVATHGYDNYGPLMQATFIAAGPAFKAGSQPPTFDNVEVYGIVACALGITPAKTDGNTENIQSFMTKACD